MDIILKKYAILMITHSSAHTCLNYLFLYLLLLIVVIVLEIVVYKFFEL